MIDHTPDNPHHAVRVHQLLQRAVRNTLPADQYNELVHTAADSLIAAWPEVERDTSLSQALRANTEALAFRAEDALYQADAHFVLFRIGLSLRESGQLAAALHHFQHLANTTQHHLGPDHPDTLAARNNLATLRGEAGDAAGAATALEQLLLDRERVLGPDHPDTLRTRSYLAVLRGLAGDVDGAAAALEEVLSDQERVLGTDHPDTPATRSYLAAFRGEADS
ncbi:tetratricopeptide repeat protein [Streptomyces asiaticus]